MPLYVEFIELFFSKILKLNGHPFFITSLASAPSSWIIAREWDKSVIAKSVSLKTSKIFLSKSFFVDTKSQFFGPLHKTLVSLLLTTLSGSFFNFKLSISILSNVTEELLYWNIWTISKFLISETFNKLSSFLFS